MDKLTTLRIYTRAYLTNATQLATSRIARQWMDSMDYRHAEDAEIEVHARNAAKWASVGMLPEEALPLIASGMTLDMVLAADPQTDGERIGYLADRIQMLGHDHG